MTNSLRFIASAISPIFLIFSSSEPLSVFLMVKHFTFQEAILKMLVFKLSFSDFETCSDFCKSFSHFLNFYWIGNDRQGVIIYIEEGEVSHVLM